MIGSKTCADAKPSSTQVAVPGRVLADRDVRAIALAAVRGGNPEERRDQDLSAVSDPHGMPTCLALLAALMGYMRALNVRSVYAEVGVGMNVGIWANMCKHNRW